MSADQTPKDRRIVVAIDGSTPSEWALEVAKRFAHDLAGRVLVVTVVEPQRLDQENIVAAANVAAILRQTAEELLVKAKASFVPSVKVETRLLLGPAAEKIVSAAEAWGADLIVLGSHGRGRIAQLLVGSTTAAVIRMATCPVIAVAHKPRTSTEKHDPNWVGIGSDSLDPVSAHPA